ncbi:MAG TPA: 3-hydroxybutyrate dehydrogenase [Nocardioidaceae bacterium]|nr:3-hydroxybutyrate dehydrogenase [Nocardioidaceae bacterium]
MAPPDTSPSVPFGPSGLGGRTVLVTGAASGIGRACAQAFAAAGADVLVLDRDPDGARAVADEVGGKALVADLAEPGALFDGGPLDGLDADIVVNNAGLQHVAPVQDFDPDKFGVILRVMVESPFRIARAVLPSMYDRGWGRFVHVSSVHGHRASAYKSAYVTAKHALEGLSKVLAVEGAAHGVTSSTICPGYVRTPLVEGQLADQAAAHGIPEEQVLNDVLLARTPVKRLIEPAEVAGLAVYLCGPGSASMSGSSYEMAGAWTAT